ncbi:MAG TPA: ABC transporter ATP-binding protein [Sphingomicrobium sp.]|nr:ABC transporter ATP-binding protein [Sphingomicrobium sp.]
MIEANTTGSEMRMGDALLALYRSLSRRRRRQAWATIALMLVGAVAEVVSVGSILPFLAVLTNPTRLDTIPIVSGLIAMLPPGTNLVAVTAMAFIGLFIFAGLIRLALAWVSQALTFSIAYDLSVSAFAKLIHQPYSYYVARHSGEALSQFEKLQYLTFSVLLQGVQALISTVIATLLITLLIVINPTVALISAGLLIGTYVLISFGVQAVLRRNSEAVSLHAMLRVKRVQEALGGIRDILLDRSQPAFEREFERSANIFRRVSALNAFISMSPRIVIEMVGMVLIGAYAWSLSGSPGGLTAAIPMLGAFALGAQRLLPLLQQSYNGWSTFLINRRNLIDVVELLTLDIRKLPEAAPGERTFRQSITFDRVGYSYPTGGKVLHDVSLTISRGERIGIAGTTGSGKSTLMDLLLGLLEPTEGEILIDGRRLDDSSRAGWQSEIAHVPQAIYLTDDTLAANIAFGVPTAEIDMSRIEEAAASAGIGDFIAGLADGYATMTGERGIRLSGGQRQRIGIARALYKRASVLVFDEATSALDTRTEEGVMASVATLGKDITIVMIAHRLTTLKDCDRIIHLEAGRIDRVVEQEREAGAGLA